LHAGLLNAATGLFELVSIGPNAPPALLTIIVANGVTAFLIIMAMTSEKAGEQTQDFVGRDRRIRRHGAVHRKQGNHAVCDARHGPGLPGPVMSVATKCDPERYAVSCQHGSRGI
jgi:hypothetical protein